MLPVPPSRSPAKHCHNRLAHTVAMLMIHELTGALAERLFKTMCVSVCVGALHLPASLSPGLLCVMSEYNCSDRLLTGHTEWNTVVTQLSYRLPRSPHNTHTDTVRMSRLGRACATGTQICSGWWQTTAVEPVAACISFNILANVQSEARASRKPLDPSQTS